MSPARGHYPHVNRGTYEHELALQANGGDKIDCWRIVSTDEILLRKESTADLLREEASENRFPEPPATAVRTFAIRATNNYPVVVVLLFPPELRT